jgi:hypothetical protein
MSAASFNPVLTMCSKAVKNATHSIAQSSTDRLRQCIHLHRSIPTRQCYILVSRCPDPSVPDQSSIILHAESLSRSSFPHKVPQDPPDAFLAGIVTFPPMSMIHAAELNSVKILPSCHPCGPTITSCPLCTAFNMVIPCAGRRPVPTPATHRKTIVPSQVIASVDRIVILIAG